MSLMELMTPTKHVAPAEIETAVSPVFVVSSDFTSPVSSHSIVHLLVNVVSRLPEHQLENHIFRKLVRFIIQTSVNDPM